MNVIRILNHYQALSADVERYRLIYNEVDKSLARGGAINMDGMPHGSNIGHPTESDAIRLADAYMQYAERLNKATKYMLICERLIASVPDWRGRYVLSEHYLRFRPIDLIGEDDILSRCGRQTRRYHDEAIEWLEAKYENVTKCHSDK